MAIALDPFFAVSLGSHTTGLPMNIWLSPRGQAGHTARIWVQANHHEQCEIDHLAVVSVVDDPPHLLEGDLGADDLNRVRRYIAMNRETILDHWVGQADSPELARRLKRLSG